MQKLWGDHFFDQEEKKWTNDANPEGGKRLTRAFVQFVTDPLCKLCNAIVDGQIEQVGKMLATLNILLS